MNILSGNMDKKNFDRLIEELQQKSVAESINSTWQHFHRINRVNQNKLPGEAITVIGDHDLHYANAYVALGLMKYICDNPGVIRTKPIPEVNDLAKGLAQFGKENFDLLTALKELMATSKLMLQSDALVTSEQIRAYNECYDKCEKMVANFCAEPKRPEDEK